MFRHFLMVGQALFVSAPDYTQPTKRKRQAQTQKERGGKEEGEKRLLFKRKEERAASSTT